MSTITHLRYRVAGWIVTTFCKESRDWGSTYRFKVADWVCPHGIPDSW